MKVKITLEQLDNLGMVDMMFHQWTHFKSVNSLQINMTALWRNGFAVNEKTLKWLLSLRQKAVKQSKSV